MRIRGNASRTASSWDPTGVTQESRLPCPRVLEMGRRSLKWRSRCSAGGCTAWKDSARPRRGLSGGCTSLGRLSAQGKRIPCRQHDEGEERRFPARFSLWNMNRCNKKFATSYFLPDSPKPFQRSPSYFPDPGTKHDAHDNGVCSVHNLSRSKSQPQPAYYFAECGEL